MPGADQRLSRRLITGLVVAHLVVPPVLTWLAIVYSALGAPWPAVAAVWHGQAVLLGIWCGLAAAPFPRKVFMSLTALVWLSAMPTARQLMFTGLPPLGRVWLSYATVFGLQPFYLAVTFAASAVAVAVARTVWPRWRLITAATLDGPRASQFSIGQLMLGIAACTPWLAAARLLHDYGTFLPVRNLFGAILLSAVDSPLPAAVALLSTWAALGRGHVTGRMSAACVLLLLAELLSCFATRTEASRIVGAIVFREVQMMVTVSTLLAFRWQGYRVGAMPSGSPFLQPSGAADR
jgi:hypothetical protein